MMADGGYTPAEITAMPLSGVNALYAAWAKYPPVRLMVASYLGIKPEAKAAQVKPEPIDFAAMKAAFPGGHFRL